MSTYKATLRVGVGQADALSEALGDIAAGLLIFEDADPKFWTIEAIFQDEPNSVALESLAADAGIAIHAMRIEALPDIDWVKKSLESLPPIRAGRFFIAGAHDIAKAPEGTIRLQIEAAQAFGTGSHPTTRGCLLALDALAKRQRIRNALDLGTGSGILTFALVRLFGRPVLGTDIDAIAVATARENARINRLAPYARFVVANGLYHPTIKARAPFDLIMANILAGPLKRLARQVAQALRPGGTLVLSGLLAHQEPLVRCSYRQLGLRLAARITLDGWVTLILRR